MGKLFAIKIKRDPGGNPATFTIFLHYFTNRGVNPDLAVYQLRLVAVHFLKFREKEILAKLSGSLQDHIKHFSVVCRVVVISGERFCVVYFV